MVAVISGGTIPDRGLYAVNLPDRTRLGELDEEFVHESRVGDVFQLGSSTWRFNAIEHDRVIVTPAPGAPARMPFWHGEYSARSAHLAARVGQLRRELAAVETDDERGALAERYHADAATVEQLVDYVHEQRAATGVVPDEQTLIVEQFRDEMDSVRLVVHAPFGGRVNAPWGMALANRVREWLAEQGRGARDGPAFEVQVQTTDDGIMLRLPNLREWLPVSIVRDLSAAEAERRVLAEIGGSSLFGSRFRTNAARALLLPRGNPRRRMPLWLQRLKALDLLQAVQEFPSFPILIETYRDVMQDAFDLPALRRVLDDVATGVVSMRTVETRLPSPFAASLQFGFVMDWLYADDAPRAEQRAALLSLDRSMLDELMGGAGADDATMSMLDAMLARRRGTAPGARARSADELALLLDRASDLTLSELQARVAPESEGRRGDPVRELFDRGRAIEVDIPIGGGGSERRVVLAENAARISAAFVEGSQPARRELLVRFVSLAGAFSVDDVLARYDFDRAWVESRLDEWTRAGRLVRGTFGRDERARGAAHWCSRRLLEQARRRELAQARKSVEAVDLPRFARFVQQWQHVDPATRLADDDATAVVVKQMYGLARPAELWEREYLPARVAMPDTDALSRLIALGELVWVGGGVAGDFASVRFVRRGTARAWIDVSSEPELSEHARRALEALQRDGASFFDELLTSVGVSSRALRDGLRELVANGLATNDTMESMRLVARWRPLVSPRDRAQPDPTRWLPADFSRAAHRPIVQRRPNLRRLPKWKRPDGSDVDVGSWPGRWSLVRTPRVLGPEAEESAWAETIARQWLERYGVVAREMWRRERPVVAWRAIYRELKRLEFRGDVRRGYFVRGLSGAQFALPDAVERLRAPGSADAPAVVISASDPANVFMLPLPGSAARDPFVRARSRTSLLVTIDGTVMLIAERRGERILIRPDTSDEVVTRCATALAEHLSARVRRDLVVDTIDAQPASGGRYVAAFQAAGFKRSTAGLRYYIGL